MRALIRLMTVPAEKRDAAWLAESLQTAVELEMSTIPPYLYAAWSIDAGRDPSDVRDVIVGIAKEEMLHMGIACNLLASIGGQPKIVRSGAQVPDITSPSTSTRACRSRWNRSPATCCSGRSWR